MALLVSLRAMTRERLRFQAQTPETPHPSDQDEMRPTADRPG
jgi:hypothetical protein